VTGVVAGGVVIAHKGAREGRKMAIPFGPFLALGALVAVFAGQQIVDLYINHFVH
jgi:leader peptidase (prepilin peptidase)/N-methyltransferase